MKKRVKPNFVDTEFSAALFYLFSISMALMYVLCKSQIVVCTVLMTAMSAGMYLIFYRFRRRKLLSLTVFFAIFFLVMMVSGMVNAAYGPVALARFIFDASSYFDPMLAFASMLMFSLIITFPTAYFTAYLPRPGFLILPAMVPLILSARVTGGLPIAMLAVLVVGYILAAAGIARAEVPDTIVYFTDKRARIERIAAMIGAGALAMVMLILAPISDNTPYGQFMDTLLLYRGNVSFGTQTISEFEERTRPNTGYNSPSTNAVFVASADYPYKVTRATFDIYEGEDGWTYYDGHYDYGDWNIYRELDITSLINSLKYAAYNGKLEQYKDALDAVESRRDTTEGVMTIRMVDGSSGRVVLHPSNTYRVYFTTAYQGNIFRNNNDEIWTGSSYGSNPSYELRFYNGAPNEGFIRMLEEVDFEQLLYEACMQGAIDFETYQAFVSELQFAEQYYEITNDGSISEEIRQLAEQITSGLTNDYEKALAIERYFENGFTYDLDFVPEEATADYFLFTSKTGICSDFATASTLLLRAAGIPARYVEGYQLSDDSMDVYGRYIVKGDQAHAYAAAYIKGYGWLEIDGTRYASVSSSDNQLKSVLLVLLIAAGILLVLAVIFHRQLGELCFRIGYRFMNKKHRIRSVYFRVRKMACRIDGTSVKSATAEEVCSVVTLSLDLGEQAALITDAANELFYGSGDPQVDTKQLFNSYKAIYKMKRSRKK